MGFLANGQCYSTKYAAAQSSCSLYPMVVANTGEVRKCTAFAADGSSISVQRDTSAPAVVAMAYAACDSSEQYTDLMTIWGFGLSALVAVFVVKAFIYRLAANQ